VPLVHSEVPEFVCLKCGRTLTVLTGFVGEEVRVPPPGAFSLCVYCGDLAVFTDDGRLREPYDFERIDMEQDPTVRNVQRVIKRIGAMKSDLTGERSEHDR